MHAVQTYLTTTMSMSISRTILFVITLAVSGGSASLEAQNLVRAAAGAAVPVGGAGERRDIGPAATLSVESGLTNWILRLDAEWSLLRGPAAPAGQEHFSNYQDLRTLGISLNGIMRPSEDRLAPYLLIGVGAYRLQQVGASASPYGTTGALQAGIGLDTYLWGRVNPFVEARAQVHLTDYGAQEFEPTVFWPVLIGLRFTPR
jgi:hypothetical protein